MATDTAVELYSGVHKFVNNLSENYFLYGRAYTDVETYIHEQNLTHEPRIFKLTELADLYTIRFSKLSVVNRIVNKTRLKEKLFSHVADLTYLFDG